MSNLKNLLGRLGEEAAIDFLLKKGYSIREKNFRNQLGEIDIIANDGDVLCFIEVKARNSDELGSPFESVTLSKQRQIGRVALSYLKWKGHHDVQSRFDVVAVYLDENSHPNIDLIQNAFELQTEF